MARSPFSTMRLALRTRPSVIDALLSDTTSSDNTAVGDIAMLNNVDGGSNTAVGVAALRDNISGINNCALGRGALRFTTGSDNIAIGREAGANHRLRAITLFPSASLAMLCL